MGTKLALNYHRDQAKSVADCFQRILDRINPKYAPMWLLSELHEYRHVAQCIQAERERDIRRTQSNKINLNSGQAAELNISSGLSPG